MSIRSYIDQIRHSSTIKNIFKVYGGDLITKILAAVTAIILIRTLSQPDYAFYVSFTTAAFILISLIGNGINNSLIRYSSEQIDVTGKKPYNLYFISLLVQVAIVCILILLVFAFPSISAKIVFGKPEQKSILIISMIYGLGNIFLLWGQSVLKSEERFNDYIKTLWVRQILFILIVIVLLVFKVINFKTTAWSMSITQLLLGLWMVYYCFEKGNLQEELLANEQNKELAISFFKKYSWLIVFGIILAVIGRLDILFLSRYATTSELANYGVALQYYTMAILLLGSISAVLYPKFAKIEMQNPTAQQEFLKKWISSLVWLIIPIAIVILVGKPIYVLINGAQYQKSYIMISILAVSVWLSLLLDPLTNIIISRKKFSFLFFLSLTTLVASLPIFYFFVRKFGGIGAAIAVIIVNNLLLQLPIFLKVLDRKTISKNALSE